MQKYKTIKISINGKRFDAIVADSLVKRMIGLMFRKRLASNQCMLLSFFSEGYQSIWMYHMLFPIDMVWVNAKMSIVDIRQDRRPCGSFSNCRAYIPKEKAKYVIEFASGTVKNNRIKEKMAVTILG
jgi:uncharacterized protein